MRTLITTSAIALALSMANLSVASVTMTNTDTNYKIEVTLEQTTPQALTFTSGAEDFYRGDFQSLSQEKLKSLTTMDLYTGMGGAEMPSIRYVTD